MTSVFDVLSAHHFFISDEDEADMDKAISGFLRLDSDYDHANMALRTCTCGKRINGFDEAHDHLRDEIERTIQ